MQAQVVDPDEWEFTDLHAGDCVLQKGYLRIFPSGHVEWWARVMSNHAPGIDVWHITFHIQDTAGNLLFDWGSISSPGMHGEPSPMYTWDQNSMSTSPENAKRAQKVVVDSSC